MHIYVDYTFLPGSSESDKRNVFARGTTGGVATTADGLIGGGAVARNMEHAQVLAAELKAFACVDAHSVRIVERE